MGRSLKNDQKAGKTAPNCHREHEPCRPALVACSAAARTGFRSVELLEWNYRRNRAFEMPIPELLRNGALVGQVAAMCLLTDR